MKLYKINGSKGCSACGAEAAFYLDGVKVCLCRDCTLGAYKALGKELVPKAIPNVVVRSEERNKALSLPSIDAEKIGDINGSDMNAGQKFPHGTGGKNEKCAKAAQTGNGNTGATASRIKSWRSKWQSMKKKS